LGALARNTDFTRDSPGVTCAGTRAGNNLAMQLVSANGQPSQLPGTGAIFYEYEPELPSDADLFPPTGFFQMVLALEGGGCLQREAPAGSGHMQKLVTDSRVTIPAGSHMIGAPADNKVWAALTDLTVPTAQGICIDPRAVMTGAGAAAVNPIGMKPVGWYWQPNTAVLANEVACPPAPSTGNGHTYQAQNNGVTGPNPPVFPLTEGGTVIETLSASQIAQGLVPVTWKEKTMVMANRIPAPPAPAPLALTSGGTFAAGRAVFILLTFTNGMGETIAGPASSITTTAADQAIQVPIPSLASLPGWLSQLTTQYAITGANVYEADVAAGQPAPPQSAFQLVGSATLGSTATVNAPGAGANPPTQNSARITPGQLPTPDTEPVITRSSAGATVTPPGAADLTLVPGGGGFPASQTVYILLTLTNAAGETTPGAIAAVTTTAAGQGVRVSLATNYGPTVTGVNIYEADDPETDTPPVSSVFRLVGSFALGATTVITATASGANPPTTNTADLPTGAFPAGRDVYVALTYLNNIGETPLGPPSSIIDTLADDAVLVTLAAVPEFPQITQVNIYEADVPTGATPPTSSAFALVGTFSVTATAFILQSATGPNPPTVNGTGPGGAIVADTATGGANGGQGFRYAALLWMNQNETVSGFTIASVIPYDVDEDGWEIALFNILIGPVNIVARLCAFTGADSSVDGPYNWSGLINLIEPSQNVVYPMTTLVDAIEESATAIFDNVTAQAIFNFDDTFMDSENNVDDRTDLLAPVQACRIDYLKTVNCLAYSGVLGFSGGGLISIGGDPESIDADTGPLPFPSDGQKCFGFTDAYKSVIFALRSEGGYVVQPNTGNPSSWDVVQRWTDFGPCGFRAWDANGKFIFFVHRSGAYKYDEADPDMMSKEVPRKWSTINWAAAAGICVTIDEDTHTVRIQVPTGQSTVNNEEFCLSYLEGWQNPIHFSTFSGKEISMDAARRWSFNDIAATMAVRMNRILPPGPAYMDGPDWTTQPDSSFGISQLIFVSSGFDGAVLARTPGVYSDNGAGIDWQWESVCAGMMQAVCKPEGVNLNVLGHGQIYWCFLAARDQDAGPNGAKNEIPIGDGWFELDSGQRIGITGKCEPSINEYFRVRFTNNKTAGSWCSLKQMTVYLIPLTAGRGEWETNR
jgi:hypothetical protein